MRGSPSAALPCMLSLAMILKIPSDKAKVVAHWEEAFNIRGCLANHV